MQQVGSHVTAAAHASRAACTTGPPGPFSWQAGPAVPVAFHAPAAHGKGSASSSLSDASSSPPRVCQAGTVTSALLLPLRSAPQVG